MSFVKTSMPVPALTRRSVANPNKGKSKYDFASLAEGEGIVDTAVVNVEKAVARLTSAVASYRKRSGDTNKFVVRSFKNEDDTDGVGVWRVAAEVAAAPTA